MDSLHANASRARQRPRGRMSVSALDKRLGLRRRAREDAARNLPRPDAADLSGAELAILEAVAAERAHVDQARAEAKAEIEQKLRALAPHPQDFAGPALEARLGLQQATGRASHTWSQAAAAAAGTQAELAAFKRAHDLRRAAHYPDSTLLQAGLLFAAALFEALFSAALFAEDDERGLLGGAITAIGLSGANVTLGFLAGFLGLRYLQHVRWAIRAMGGAGFAAMALLALMLNLFAADWRDEMAALSGRQLDLGADASFRLWSLLQLESPQAIILLMLGAGVWVFAAMKGYSGFDDPYPDYGKMDRAVRAADEDYAELRAEGRTSLEAPITAGIQAISARLAEMRAEVDSMSRAFDHAAAEMEALDAEARALDQHAADAVHFYRQENAAARQGPAPAYFGEPPPAAGPALDALGPAAAMLDAARARLAEAQEQSAEAQSALAQALEDAAARLDAAPAP
ncbi:MAG TPA: hypothetical protein PLK37_06890 [Terricaulis sp.]|nr:hypothetical protein [Terricaulis sp.]